MRKVVFLLLSIIMALLTTNMTNAITITSAKEAGLEVNVNLPEYGYEINFDKADLGVVQVFYNNRLEKKIKLVVQLDDEKYIYNVFNNETYVNYPLQLGNGTYKVSLYENTTGTKYKKITSKSSVVELTDEKNVYLQSVLEVNWNEEDESIILADELVAEALDEKQNKFGEDLRENVTLTEDEIIEVIYDFVIHNIDYDYDKIDGLDYSYVPDNDTTLELGTGICYDYSSLLASMLRSQGVPAKMTKGYAKTSNVYHAWNEIYLEKEKRWIVVDTTYDAYMAKKGYPFSMEKESGDYNKVKEF